MADSYVTLPSGWHMPRLGFGTAGLGSRTEEAVSAALAAGYRLIDTAQAGEWYREDSVGAALHKSAVRREQVFITTKIHPRHLGYDVTTARIRVSLRALDTHYLDLLLLHYPECWGNLCDGMQPAGTWKESWRALEAAHREGTVRSLGVSNFDAGQVRELLAWAQVPPSVVQAGSDPYASNAGCGRCAGSTASRLWGTARWAPSGGGGATTRATPCWRPAPWCRLPQPTG